MIWKVSFNFEVLVQRDNLRQNEFASMKSWWKETDLRKIVIGIIVEKIGYFNWR